MFSLQVILVENKEQSIQRAETRIEKLNLKNIILYQVCVCLSVHLSACMYICLSVSLSLSVRGQRSIFNNVTPLADGGGIQVISVCTCVCVSPSTVYMLSHSYFQCNLDYFTGIFDIGVCLHACGVATDLVLQCCLKNNASFVICPCCYGGIQNTHTVNYPRSSLYRKSGLTYEVSEG